MTDAELEVYLGIARCSAETRAKLMAAITPEKRAMYERAARLEVEGAPWQDFCGRGKR